MNVLVDRKYMYITGSKLYDYIQCPHRVWRDVHGPQNEKIQETNPFVQLLWDRGVSHEKAVIADLGSFLDLSEGTQEERFAKTMEAMRRGEPLIYQGLLRSENILGIPDLLKKMPDGTYIPVEIKSGSGLEGGDEEEGEEGKPKKHYAVQLALYLEALEKLGFKHQRKGAVLDIHRNEVEYRLDEPMGVRNKTTFWEYYLQVKEAVLLLLENEEKNKPAMAGICKLCPWYKSCKKWCNDNDDLSNVFYLGRSKRDLLNEDLGVAKVTELAAVDTEEILAKKAKDKMFLKGVGEKTLKNMVARANILANTKTPVVYEKPAFPNVSYELFFDIEDDPTREFVYMHGVCERNAGKERYLHFTATDNTKDAEKDAWVRFWQYVNNLPKDDFAVYYYSHHEKTTYRRMQKQYPDVISSEDLENFFSNTNVIDLYKIVLSNTDWPVSSYSLKELAVYLGFKWRDETPSGALSIQWYNEYLKSKDEKQLERILLYNEDDCIATRVLKDGIEKIAASA
jgi:predicted RecB family nuclease